MNIRDIRPFIRFAERLRLSSSPFFTKCRDRRLVYVVSGSFTFFFGDRQAIVPAGSVLYFVPGVRYRFMVSEKPEVFILNFDLTDGYRNLTEPLHVLPESEFRDDMILPEPEPDELVTDNGMLLLRGMGRIGNDLALIAREMDERKLYFRETMSAVMSRVICEMARAVLSDGNTDTVARTIDFIRENFARPITNRDIASNVNYHEFYVNKLIKRQTGMTLHRYLTAIRVQEAKRLLTSTSEPVSKIAASCGFASDAYFISAFGREVGITPSEYRRLHGGLI